MPRLFPTADSPSGGDACPLPSNPFATRFIRPGALPFAFPDGQNISTLVAQLREHRWHGEIVGPHGTGKSSLLAALLPACAQAGRVVEHRQLHQGEHSLPWTKAQCLAWHERTLVVLDGYEQLRWFGRWRLRSACRRANCGLLVTSHHSAGLPLLYRTSTTADLAISIARHLLGSNTSAISPDDIRACFARHGGNLRDTLLALYDLYEQRRHAKI